MAKQDQKSTTSDTGDAATAVMDPPQDAKQAAKQAEAEARMRIAEQDQEAEIDRRVRLIQQATGEKYPRETLAGMGDKAFDVLLAEKRRPPKPTMPYVELGMAIYWYPDGTRSRAPRSSIVTKIGTNSISVVGYRDVGGIEANDGVRHIDDPQRREADNDEGAWEHTPLNKKLIELSDMDWVHDPSTNSWR